MQALWFNTKAGSQFPAGRGIGLAADIRIPDIAAWLRIGTRQLDRRPDAGVDVQVERLAFDNLDVDRQRTRATKKFAVAEIDLVMTDGKRCLEGNVRFK